MPGSGKRMNSLEKRIAALEKQLQGRQSKSTDDLEKKLDGIFAKYSK
jgi:hypothetical protein